jgi:hypothetical protein
MRRGGNKEGRREGRREEEGGERDTSLHMIVATTHCFGETRMDCLVKDNVNPIEKVSEGGRREGEEGGDRGRGDRSLHMIVDTSHCFGETLIDTWSRKCQSH